MNNFKQIEGASLLEVLIALLTLSIGLLGIAAMMLVGLSSNSGAYQRTQATIYAYDMGERLRANRNSASSYNTALDDDAPTGTTLNAIDVSDWLDLISNLPAGDGAIICADDKCDITVQWNNSKANGEETEQVIIRTQL